jgi:hypothetical protein
MPTFTRDKTTETKDFNRYTYYSYELRRQVKISLIFRKIRLFYIGYCIIFLVAAYPYLNYSRLAATGLIVLSTAYGILRYFRESRMEREWPRDFWLDLFFLYCLHHTYSGCDYPFQYKGRVIRPGTGHPFYWVKRPGWQN